MRSIFSFAIVLTFALGSIANGPNSVNEFNEKVTITLALKQDPVAVSLIDTLWNEIADPYSENYRKFMTADQIGEIMRLSVDDENTLFSWMNSKQVTEYMYNGDSIVITENQDVMEELLGVKLIYCIFLKRYIRTTDTYQLPENVTNIVEFIIGIDHYTNGCSFELLDQGRGRIGSYVTKKGVPDSAFAGREVFQRVFNVPNVTASDTVSVGAIEFMDSTGYDGESVIYSQEMNGISVPQNVTKRGESYFTDTETQLDLDMLTYSGAPVYYWGTPLWMYTFSVGFLNSNQSKPDIISMSWGWAESQQCSVVQCNGIDSRTYVDRTNTEFAKMGLNGTTIVVSSGDAGAPSRVDPTCTGSVNDPDFPASSPYVTTVGAVYLEMNQDRHGSDYRNRSDYWTPLCQQYGCATGSTPRNTNYNETGWTSGGGFSNFTSSPVWQQQQVNEYINSGVYLPPNDRWNKTGRGYPDVTAIGHACPVFDAFGFSSSTDFKPSGIDGTSCSSPMFAAMLAMLPGPIGPITPTLYAMYRDNSSIFLDPTVGSNHGTSAMSCPETYGYEATKGWDPVYGLGLMNVQAAIDWFG